MLLAACGAPSSGGRPEESGDPFAQAGQGKVIKVTYIRFNYDPRVRRFVHEYRVMLSASWRLKNGKSPREPFVKLFKNAFLNEEIPDQVLDQLVTEMKRHGLDKLRSTSAEAIDLEKLKAVEKTSQQEVASSWRIMNVETEDMKKTVTFYDNDDRPAKEGLAWTFSLVEREVIKFAIQWTVQVTYEAPPMIPK